MSYESTSTCSELDRTNFDEVNVKNKKFLPRHILHFRYPEALESPKQKIITRIQKKITRVTGRSVTTAKKRIMPQSSNDQVNQLDSVIWLSIIVSSFGECRVFNRDLLTTLLAELHVFLLKDISGVL